MTKLETTPLDAEELQSARSWLRMRMSFDKRTPFDGARWLATVDDRDREIARLKSEIAAVRYALSMAEAAEDLARQEAYEDTDARRLECALTQMHEVEAVNAKLAAERDALKAELARLKEVQNE